MTNKEFVELMDKIWYIDPDEEEDLLEESFNEGYREFIEDEYDELEEGEEK
jgi:hypothetical protein